MPAAVAERLRERFGLTYGEGYGLTETMGATHRNPREKPKLQCLGIPFIGTDARIVDPDTGAELPAGETGEIVVHGPQVFDGYWRNETATAECGLRLDGKRFFRTGDLGHVDDEGYFFLTDRLKRMINASGFKVWPAEVEAALHRHPAIREACVVRAKDAYRGETVKAYVVRSERHHETVTEQDIIDWARTQLAAYKCPRIVEFIGALPKSSAGKLMWRELQEKEDARV
jgi:fatty-acyl-CoA synthase